MSQLIGFINYISREHLKAAATEILTVSRRIKFPLLQRFRPLSEDELLTSSMKRLEDMAESLTRGTYLDEQKDLIRQIETAGVNGVLKDDITQVDLTMIFAIRRIVFRKFLPQYTKDVQVAMDIMDELEQMHIDLQELAYDVLFRDQHRKEEEMRKSNLFLSAILENIPDMIFLKDATDLRFVIFNKAGENLLGYSRDELNGKNDYDFFPTEQADFFIQKDREVLKSKKLLDIAEEPIQTRDQGERWLHTKKIPLLGENGEPEFLLGISADISENKKKEDAILELNKELEAFSYSVSHDLRAPLRAINGYARMLKEDFGKELGTEAEQMLETINRNAEKMGRLIDELLAFSRLGRKELLKSQIDMNEVAEGVLREIEQSGKSGAKIDCENLPPVLADYSLIHQVLFNLVSNAVKYSSKTAEPRVNIRSRKEGNEIFFTVTDNGVGFNMRYANKLFGVFQRLHLEDEFEGTGVGLAIVKRIINKHNGKVYAEGKEGKGASFTFTLPA
jgi:PAS domain S-box-containing protein